jgi:hypothetical protein
VLARFVGTSLFRRTDRWGVDVRCAVTSAKGFQEVSEFLFFCFSPKRETNRRVDAVSGSFSFIRIAPGASRERTLRPVCLFRWNPRPSRACSGTARRRPPPARCCAQAPLPWLRSSWQTVNRRGWRTSLRRSCFPSQAASAAPSRAWPAPRRLKRHPSRAPFFAARGPQPHPAAAADDEGPCVGRRECRPPCCHPP